MSDEQNQADKVSDKNNSFEQSVINLLINYLLDKNEDTERQKFGETLIKILQDNVENLTISCERVQAKENFIQDIKEAKNYSHLVSEDIKNEYQDMMN